ncbi:hypothetical protein D3C85_1704480 [compost metagenome]
MFRACYARPTGLPAASLRFHLADAEVYYAKIHAHEHLAPTKTRDRLFRSRPGQRGTMLEGESLDYARRHHV